MQIVQNTSRSCVRQALGGAPFAGHVGAARARPSAGVAWESGAWHQQGADRDLLERPWRGRHRYTRYFVFVGS